MHTCGALLLRRCCNTHARILLATTCGCASSRNRRAATVQAAVEQRVVAAQPAVEPNEYGADKIQVLEGLDPVRKRPGMYIGSTGQKGLHHLVWEIVDNAIDEVQGDHADRVFVELDCDTRWVKVRDNGRGIPTDLHPTTGKSALETVLTVLHAGGKFGSGGYVTSGGLHGVGLSVVNALSEELRVTVTRRGRVFTQVFARGRPLGPMAEAPASNGSLHEDGTEISFLYDASVFSTEAAYDVATVRSRLRELAFLNAAATIEVVARKGGDESRDEFKYEGGIAEYVGHLQADEPVLHDVIHFSRAHTEASGVKYQVEVALQWANASSETLLSFVNCIRTVDGGTHLDGMKQAVTRTINKLAREKGHLKEADKNLAGEHVREGLTAVVSVQVPEPEFEGQTKTRLGNPEVRSLCMRLVSESLEEFLRVDSATLKVIVEKALLAQRAADAARRAREMIKRKTVLTRSTLPGKLADCTGKTVDETEIFIVEGDSAGGSAKQARDRTFQAILPLRGKILNVERVDEQAIYKNRELSDLIVALGMQVRGMATSDSSDSDSDQISDQLQRLRYGKIVLLTDADVDGAHIRTLLLTFLYRCQPSLFHHGRVFVAQPPLYKLEAGRGKSWYCFDDKELEARVAALKGGSHTVQRFKGLGEMMPEQLWETTMDPARRKLLRLTLDDLATTERLIKALMGQDASRRRELIMETAPQVVRQLDV